MNKEIIIHRENEEWEEFKKAEARRVPHSKRRRKEIKEKLKSLIKKSIGGLNESFSV